jgi:hypothetical protein
MVPRTRTRSCANALVATIANPIAVTPTAHRVISLMVVLLTGTARQCIRINPPVD